MDNNDLKQTLTLAYKKNPFYYGAEALSGVLSKLDIQSFTKENLDTIFRFIDAPQNGGGLWKDEREILANKDITSYVHEQNLIYILENLPDFVLLDPKKYNKNTPMAEDMADAITPLFPEFQKTWNGGSVHKKTEVLSMAFDSLLENIPNAPAYEFVSSSAPFRAAFCPEEYKIKIKQNEKTFEKYGFSGLLSFFVHELEHSMQFQAEKTDPMMKLYNFYYIDPITSNITGKMAYFKNYVEMDASDVAEKFIKALRLAKTKER